MNRLKKYLNIVNGINESEVKEVDLNKIGIHGKTFLKKEKKIIDLVNHYCTIFNSDGFKFDKEKLYETMIFSKHAGDFDKKEAMRFLQEIEKFKENLSKLLPEITTASSSQKAKHPRMGLFNAKQWLRFIEIHTRHHEKQLYRIEAALKKP